MSDHECLRNVSLQPSRWPPWSNTSVAMDRYPDHYYCLGERTRRLQYALRIIRISIMGT